MAVLIVAIAIIEYHRDRPWGARLRVRCNRQAHQHWERPCVFWNGLAARHLVRQNHRHLGEKYLVNGLREYH